MTDRTEWIPGTTQPVRRGWYERAVLLYPDGVWHNVAPAVWGGARWYVWYNGGLVASRLGPRTFSWRGATTPQELPR